MADSKVPMRIELETSIEGSLEGTLVELVTVDQRDFARAEAADITRTRAATWIRFLGFCALTRTGRYKGTWERFNEIDCIEVIEQEATAGADDADDPGPPGRGAGS